MHTLQMMVQEPQGFSMSQASVQLPRYCAAVGDDDRAVDVAGGGRAQERADLRHLSARAEAMGRDVAQLQRLVVGHARLAYSFSRSAVVSIEPGASALMVTSWRAQ